MDLQLVILLLAVLGVMAAIVIFCFRVGRASNFGELNEANVALRLYREYMQKKNSSSIEAVQGFLKRIDEAKPCMSRGDYDVLSMNAAGLLTDLKKQADAKAPIQIHGVR